ncbi:hypothetical protein B0H13DRAFT_2353541 [Mycena leptocephala]|nr:hypothetical protein B0H13DRAFT_2353541 [Mycena leptocephala]
MNNDTRMDASPQSGYQLVFIGGGIGGAGGKGLLGRGGEGGTGEGPRISLSQTYGGKISIDVQGDLHFDSSNEKEISLVDVNRAGAGKARQDKVPQPPRTPPHTPPKGDRAQDLNLPTGAAATRAHLMFITLLKPGFNVYRVIMPVLGDPRPHPSTTPACPCVGFVSTPEAVRDASRTLDLIMSRQAGSSLAPVVDVAIRDSAAAAAAGDQPCNAI